MVKSVCSAVVVCGALTLFSSCDFTGNSGSTIFSNPPPTETSFIWDEDNWDEEEWQ